VDNFPASIAGNAAIPIVQLTGSATAQLRPPLDAGTLRVRLAGRLRATLQTHDPRLEDTASRFTSRGVRSMVKPDVAAPGDTIASARVGSGDGVLVNSGTSMAAPHVAGIAALLREAHRGWSPADVKAAIMATASHDVRTDGVGNRPVQGPNRVGAGRVDAQAALDNTVLAFSDDEPSSVSVGFGVVEAPRPMRITRTVKVVNKGTTTAGYHVRYEDVTSLPGVRFELDETSLTVRPRATARIRITLTIDDPAQLRKIADPAIEKLQNLHGADAPRQFIADASGRVVFTPASGADVTLRVPVYAAPKPVADIRTPNVIRVDNGGRGMLTLAGRGLDQGSGDQRYQSLISAFELQARSPRLPPCGNLILSGCAVNETARGGDLRYVGVASTAPLARQRGAPAEAMLGFGIATWDDWYNIGSNTQPVVDIDADGDGSADFEVRVARPADTDLLLAVTTDLKTRATVDIRPVNGLFGDVDANVFDTNVVVLPVLLTRLGVDVASEPTHRLSYRVRVEGLYAGADGLVDSIDRRLSFDPLRPGLWVHGLADRADAASAFCYVAKQGTSLVVTRDVAALADDNADSVLLLHHHNRTRDRAEVVHVFGRGSAPSRFVT
jgi:hypothetical protein